VATPPATAQFSDYDSANLYAAIVEARSHCSRAYQECVDEAQTELTTGLYICSKLPTYQMQFTCSSGKRTGYTADLATCSRNYVCSPYDCDQDSVRPYSYRCCPTGQQACNGGCVPDCPTPRHRILIDDSTCTCRCDPLLYDCSLLGGDQVRDATSCLCRCATRAEVPCPATGQVRDPYTCVCICPSPTVLHNGACIDLTSDENNCGDFGVVCGQGEGCCHSQCVPLNTDKNCSRCDTDLDPTSPLYPRKCCAGVPTRLGTYVDCSNCGDACPALGGCCPHDSSHTGPWCDPGPSNQHCGRCANVTTCQTGETCCYTLTHNVATPTSGHHCANLQTSTSNCGTCSNACLSGRVCTAGVCRCPTGKQPCGTTSQHGPQFCCDTAMGQKCCSNQCVDSLHDPMNCGNCGVICTGGKQCVNGQCVCPAPLSDCHGICVNLQTDPNNCGQCDIHCTGGKNCVAGHCVCPQGQVDCHNLGTCCLPDACCPTGCCTGGKKCCANTCVDLQTDVNHCGTCAQICHDGMSDLFIGGQHFNFTWQRQCKSGQCACPSNMFKCGADWCAPLQWPGTNPPKPAVCCPENTFSWNMAFPWACPPGTECCNSPDVYSNNTGWWNCCRFSLGP
jgi:hypothetical protein